MLILCSSIRRSARLEDYYDLTNENRGVALIFNQEYFTGQDRREGTKKDGDDLITVLKKHKFSVRYYPDLKKDEIKDILYKGKTPEIICQKMLIDFVF